MKKIVMLMMLIVMGASNAYAITRCSNVCRGNSEPCDMPCYLDNHFVTTCDQVYGGRCVNLATEDAAEDAEAAPALCEAEIDVVPMVAEWINAGMTAAGNIASVLGAVVG